MVLLMKSRNEKTEIRVLIPVVSVAFTFAQIRLKKMNRKGPRSPKRVTYQQSLDQHGRVMAIPSPDLGKTYFQKVPSNAKVKIEIHF